MDFMSLLTSLVSGGVGGNIAGALSKEKSLGPVLNSILGAVGGGLGGQVLPMIVSSLQGRGMAQNAGLSAVIGAALPFIISMLKKKA